MTATHRIRILLVPLAALAALAALGGCRPAKAPVLDPAGLALLRLEYLERAAGLPALNIDRIDVPREEFLGRYSPVVWRIRSELAAGGEVFRPLPVDDLDLQLRESLMRTLEDFGFNMRGWTSTPGLRMRVEVARLVLLSEEGPQSRRVCDLELRFHIDEFPSGLPIESFRTGARRELSGSWTVLRGKEAVWIPRDATDDPIALAAVSATQQFLHESLEFWKDRSRWEGGGLRLSSANP